MRLLLLLTFNTTCVFLQQVCWVVACFVFSRLSAAFLLFYVSVLLLCRCFFVSFSLPFFCLYFFSLYVSVLFSSCAVSPVSLFLVSDTRVSCIPRPGCQTCRDPGVEHVKTRVSYNALPYLRVFFQPSVVSFHAHAHIL